MSELNATRMVRFLVMEPTHQSSCLRLGTDSCVFWIYFRPSGDVRSVGGEVPVDYECVRGDFVNLKMLC